MSNIIKGIYSWYCAHDTEQAQSYLRSQGMTFDGGIEEHGFYIEVKHQPEILTRLEAAGYLDQDKDRAWHIMSITERGISLYLCHIEAGDSYVFIPQENIICIHTVDNGFINDVRHHVAITKTTL